MDYTTSGTYVCLSPFFGTRKLYERMAEVNFSHKVLSLRPERLGVLKVMGVKWNDLGEPKRVMASLNMAGIRPHWADAAVPRFA